jgi:F0F1-type ATP synthase membrane subunit b/b'
MGNWYAQTLEILTLTPIDPPMILISMVLFFIYYKLIAYALFTKYVVFYEERENRVVGASFKAADIINEASEKLDKINNSTASARIDAMKERESIIKFAQQQVEEAIKIKDSEVKELLNRNLKELNEQSLAVRSDFPNRSKILAESAVTNILSKS